MNLTVIVIMVDEDVTYSSLCNEVEWDRRRSRDLKRPTKEDLAINIS